MGTMTAQLPLPIRPVDAVPVGTAAALSETAEGGVVFIHGEASFAWDAADVAGRRLAAVELVRIKAAKGYEIAEAFGVSSVTLWGWGKAFTASGVAGLIPAKTGPKGPSKLTSELATRIRELAEQGLSLAQVASQTGVSTFAVRTALGRIGPARSAGAETSTACEPAETASQPADSEADDEPNEAQASTRGDAEGSEQSKPDAATGAGKVSEEDAAQLPVCPDPAPRNGERAAARSGELVEASPVFTCGAKLPRAGLWLILPALEATGLLEAAGQIYGRLRNGFYGLQSMLLMLVFLALSREPRAEGATRIRPADVGRLLGLDRGPEVKTIRRKLAELAGHHKASELIENLARRHARARPEALGFLYVDGHVRVYAGKRHLPKTHVTRMRIAAPATAETWVADSDGDPLLVIPAAAADTLASELPRIAPQIRTVVGERRVTVCFDRGGYSPAAFATLTDAGFDILTYRKGHTQDQPDEAFTSRAHHDERGQAHSYELTEEQVSFDLPANHPHGASLTLRQVTRRTTDGHQIPILTSRAELPAAEVAYRIFHRWRQENYFRYARQHFALDGLDSYAAIQDNPDRQVPNPAKHTARKQVTAARTALSRAEADYARAVDATTEELRATVGQTSQTVDPKAAEAITTARAELDRLQAQLAALPARVPLSTVEPEAQLLETETKLVTHAVRMSTYNAESALARALGAHYARADDEARALLRQAFQTSGDIQQHGNTLQVRLDPLSAPRHTRALAKLCEELTATHTRYPGTDLTLVYSMKNGHSTN
jgi:transposase